MSLGVHEKLDLAALSASGANFMPGFVGIEFIDDGDNWSKARMPVDERTKQPYGRLHGGASVAMGGGAACVIPSTTSMSQSMTHAAPPLMGSMRTLL